MASVAVGSLLDCTAMPDFEFLEGVASVPRDEWNALVGDASPFLEWEWLASLEEAGTLDSRSGWSPRPLVVRENGQLVGACPLYLKGNSEGEFVFDFSWRWRREANTF